MTFSLPDSASLKSYVRTLNKSNNSVGGLVTGVVLDIAKSLFN